jgi:hypothetical protein
MAGTMIPLGDAKGTALALMVELLCAGLTGANYAWQATSFFDDKGDPPGTGQAIIAIDPDAFGPGGAERMALMAEMVAGTEGARLPGRRRQQIRADYLANGIPVDAVLADQISAIGALRLSRPSGPDLSAPDVVLPCPALGSIEQPDSHQRDRREHGQDRDADNVGDHKRATPRDRSRKAACPWPSS